MNLPDHFWSKVNRDGAEGCWLWTAATSSKGYGCFHFAGRLHRSHRLSYEALVGPIPEDQVIHHICHRKICVNPAHLQPMGQREHLIQHHAELGHAPGLPYTPVPKNGDYPDHINPDRLMSHATFVSGCRCEGCCNAERGYQRVSKRRQRRNPRVMVK